MLDYSILAGKKRVTRNSIDGSEDKQIDLLTHVIDNVDIRPSDIIIVNEHYVARPDLISLAAYGNDKYGDIICKYNGISNPFELNEGDLIYIPDFSEFRFMFNTKMAASEFIDEDDSKSSLVAKEHPFQKEKNEKRTPSQQIVGESNYVIDKSLGVVFY